MGSREKTISNMPVKTINPTIISVIAKNSILGF